MAGKPKRVAIAVDNSEHALHAFRFYMQNFGHPEDYIVFIHIPEMYNFVDASPSVIHELLIEIKKNIKALEDKFTGEMKICGVKHGKFCTKEGKPGQEIVKKAEEEKCDVIVVGSRGLGKFKRVLFGSTSSYLVHHAHIPVLVFKHPDDHKEETEQTQQQMQE
ncbi:hypothetical protein FSP39_022855 [Pinctada imbricata]|uniref:UspA domain-containing protein n=1 Tax=Pinctada imbricata TaxID=66713 RepID=A0AA88YSG3_PINIB|nr:hypothetical protein FSP39_022855 [Pinctada imbricata]